MAASDVDLGKYKLGWHDTEQYVYKPKKGLNEEIVREISWHKSEPEWMTKFRLSSLQRFERKPMLDWFATNMPDDRLRRHLLLHQAHRGDGLRLGHAPRGDEDDLRAPRDPRGGAQVPRRRDQPVRVRGRLPQEPRRPREARGPLHEHGPGAQGPPRARAEAPRHRHPSGRQQVRRPQLGGLVGRLVHLRAAGSARGDAAPGLLPDQRGELGAVRADADHRRRGLVGSLHRGLFGAGLLDRLAALGRRRADREAGFSDPLLDDPELVAERLQPRHQARPRGDRGHGRVDRREPRVEAHHEVPGRGDDRPEGARRGPVGGVRRRRPAPGRRREDDPRRPGDDVDHRVEVDQQGRWTHDLSRAGQGRSPAHTA